MELGQNVCFDEISDESKKVHVGSKPRSLGHILEKPCVRFRGHSFSWIIIKLSQNDCLDEILDEFETGQNVCLSDEFENGSCQVKN